jgi:signal transduction histidine kinase
VDTIESVERLREALIDLERSRRREHELRRVEGSLLDVVHILALAEHREQTFDALLRTLRGMLDFEEAAIFAPAENACYAAIASTCGWLAEVRLEAHQTLKRVLDGHTVISFNAWAIPEWQRQNEEIRAHVHSAIHLPMRTGAEGVLLVCTHSSPARFEQRHLELADRLAPLLRQILATLDLREAFAAQERERKERLAILGAILGAMQGGILVEDGDRRVFAANDVLRAMLGISGPVEELVGTDAVALHRTLCDAASDSDGFAPRIKAIAEARQPVGSEEIPFQDGRIFERDYLPVLISGERLIAHFWQYRDVTERRRAEAQVMRSQRLESLSTLAAGIAHQFNNINTIVQGYLDVLMHEKMLLPAARRYVEEILKGVSRSVEITARLQELTRGTAAADTDSVAVGELVKSVLIVFRDQWEAESVIVRLEMDENATARASPTLLRFVVSTLLSNALHALLDRQIREVTIRCRSAVESVVLEVSDTGCGIAPSDLPRLFTPFFTTKGEWSSSGSPQAGVKGIGLSLAVCQSTVTEHGGSIEVESEPDVGSTFRVLLPRA